MRECAQTKRLSETESRIVYSGEKEEAGRAEYTGKGGKVGEEEEEEVEEEVKNNKRGEVQ